jgi:hypothetical protein
MIINYLIVCFGLIIFFVLMIWAGKKFNDYTENQANQTESDEAKALRIIRSNYKYWRR